jgi:hypothetical protein
VHAKGPTQRRLEDAATDWQMDALIHAATAGTATQRTNDACGPPAPATPERTSEPSGWIATPHAAEPKRGAMSVLTLLSPPNVACRVPSAKYRTVARRGAGPPLPACPTATILPPGSSRYHCIELDTSVSSRLRVALGVFQSRGLGLGCLASFPQLKCR